MASEPMETETPAFERIIGKEELKTKKLYLDVFSEYIATFILTFIGYGAATKWSGHREFEMQIGLAMGISIGTIYDIFNHTSGGLANPAVSFSFLIAGYIPLLRCIFYMLVQTLGGITAAAIFYLLLPSKNIDNFPVVQIALGVTEEKAFLVEFFASMIFILTWLKYVDTKTLRMNPLGSGIIGFVFTACTGASKHFSGASINPAKAMGAALVMADFDSHWIYWAGPLAAALVCALLHRFIFSPDSPFLKEKEIV